MARIYNTSANIRYQNFLVFIIAIQPKSSILLRVVLYSFIFLHRLRNE